MPITDHGIYLVPGTGVCALGGAAAGVAALVTRATFTEGGTLSALANSWLTCQSCESVRRPLKLGMPVRRMPFSASQWVFQTGSSVTPVPWNSSGGLGYMPWAMEVSGPAGSPWQTAQFCL